MDLTLEWSIDMPYPSTIAKGTRTTQRNTVYCWTPRMDGCMEAGESVTCTVEEVKQKNGNHSFSFRFYHGTDQ